MPPNNDESLSREQESSSQDELRIQRFLYLQSTAESIGKLLSELLNHGVFLKLKVNGSADGWALVLSFELR